MRIGTHALRICVPFGATNRRSESVYVLEGLILVVIVKVTHTSYLILVQTLHQLQRACYLQTTAKP